MEAWSLNWAGAHVQENNFKAVLESIRDLMNEDTVLPEWLHDIFLGYGDPAAAQYTQLPDSYLRTLDFKVGDPICRYGGSQCLSQIPSACQEKGKEDSYRCCYTSMCA